MSDGDARADFGSDPAGEPDSTESTATADDAGGLDQSDEAPSDPAAAVEQIRAEAAAVRDRQVEHALSRLDADGDLSAAQRAAVETLADRLVERLVAVPERALLDATDETEGAGPDRETVETAVELFG